MCNISLRGKLGSIIKEHSHTYITPNMKQNLQYVNNLPERELSIKVDLLDASCGGAFSDIVGQLLSIVTSQFSR